MLLPRAVEQRYDAMIEQVEERRHGEVLGLRARQHVFGVVMRQDALNTGQPQKRHGHHRRVLLSGYEMNRTGWELQALPSLEPHRLFVRLSDASDSRPVGQNQMQQTYGLEKIVLVRVLEQPLLERKQGLSHNTCCSPTRGGQRFKTPLRLRLRAVR